MTSELNRWFTGDALELKEQLQRWANTQRLEGNYVAAQTTERALSQLERAKTAARPSTTGL
jgi:hypothetical protein